MKDTLVANQANIETDVPKSKHKSKTTIITA